MNDDYECIECGCMFDVKFAYAEAEESVAYCVNCGVELEDELDENFYVDEDDL